MNQKVYPPLNFSNRNGADYEFSEIAGLLQAGWTQGDYEAAKGTEEKSFEEQCEDILKALHDHENAWPFRKPVS